MRVGVCERLDGRGWMKAGGYGSVDERGGCKGVEMRVEERVWMRKR